MTQTETSLIAVIYLIYLHDCVYWLSPDEVAMTRSSSTSWRPNAATALSFTLLGKRPLLVDPFLIRPGFVRLKLLSLPVPNRTNKALRALATRLDRWWILELQCQVQAMLLLFFLPAVIWTHRLAYGWKFFMLALLISHFLLCLSLWLAMRRCAVSKPFSLAAPFVLNPLGATRIIDALSQSLFVEPVRQGSGK
jgi:hypothetical protein